ncbi:hypothetical protein [Umezawaea tangerina]|uniref:Excalibur calcium-binding domain-containing protein n=1 Tax=Umezawaea tangerina TaxID=84725 RepID=A0A2T0TCE2_9PSEU|nr:hypothetical protein [Umezawaea tangerina]PRY43325.1 hypothetical protein CLV43_10365 [Umezawaea tangerina]
MIFGRRRVLAIAGAVLIGGSMIGALVLSGGPMPVDVRQVQGSFGPEPMLSATFTTGVVGVGPTTVPPPPPPPPVETTEVRTADPKPDPKPPVKPGGRVPPWLEELGGCDEDYQSDGLCVPWLFPMLVDECDWLRGHGVRRVEVVGEDRHELDFNRDGIGCGVGDR